jgi:hypothetical protein
MTTTVKTARSLKMRIMLVAIDVPIAGAAYIGVAHLPTHFSLLLLAEWAGCTLLANLAGRLLRMAISPNVPFHRFSSKSTPVFDDERVDNSL